MRLIDRAMAMMPGEWASRMRRVVSGDLDREQRTEQAYNDLRTRTLEEANRLAARGRAADLEKLRDKVKEEDRRLGGQRPGDIAALLATIDLEATAAIAAREARQEYEKRAPVYRKYRRSTNGAFKVFTDAAVALEQVQVDDRAARCRRSVRSPSGWRRRAAAFRKCKPPEELASAHAIIGSAWELAQNAFRLRVEAVSANNIDIAQRASSAAAGALMLYQRARADQLDRHGAAGRQVITPRRIRLLRRARPGRLSIDARRSHAGARRIDGCRHVRGRADHRGRRTARGARSMRACAITRHRPHIGPRSAISTTLLIARLPEPLRLLTGFEREAVLAAGAREAEEAGSPPPFHVRPALVAEMLALYDHLRRLGRTVDDFDRLLDRRARAGGRIGSRRGAAARADAIPVGGVSCLRIASARRRRRRRARRARPSVVGHAAPSRFGTSSIAIGDRPFDPDGYWPADVAMLTTIPGLESIDIVATRNMLDAGYLDRLRLAFVEIETSHCRRTGAARRAPSVVVVPGSGELPSFSLSRSRGRARRRGQAHQGRSPARREHRRSIASASSWRGRCRTSISRARCFPARAFRTKRSIPCRSPRSRMPRPSTWFSKRVSANFTRRSMMALLRSPHFRFQSRWRRCRSRVDRRTRRRDGGAALPRRPRSAARAGRDVDRRRASRRARRARRRHRAGAAGRSHGRWSIRSALLQAFLEAHDREHDDRRRRARAAVVTALDGLIAAYRRHDPCRDRHGHRAVGGHPPLARLADVRDRDDSRAACGSSTRNRRGSPTWRTCRSSGSSKASGPSGSAATCSIRDRSSPSSNRRGPSASPSTRSAITCAPRARCSAT